MPAADDNESPHLLDLVHQAQTNLASHSRIVHVVTDRAYVDGKTLDELDRLGIPLSCLLSTAWRSTSRRWPRALNHLWPMNDSRPSRTVRGATGHEQQDGPRIHLTNSANDDPWAIIDLYDDRSWIENGLFRNSKQFFTLTRWFPKRIAAGVRNHLTFVMLMLSTATTCRLWDKAQAGIQAVGTAAAKRAKTVTHRMVNCQTGEILPDSRSLARQAGHLAAPPLPSRHHKPLEPGALESGVSQPGALTPPFFHHLLEGQGLQRWRQQLRQANRDKLIVFIADRYAIYDTHEFLVLTRVPVSRIPPQLGSRDDILRRYGCLA